MDIEDNLVDANISEETLKFLQEENEKRIREQNWLEWLKELKIIKHKNRYRKALRA